MSQSMILMNWIQSFQKENWQGVHQREQRKEVLKEGEMKWPSKCGFSTDRFFRTEEIFNLQLEILLHRNRRYSQKQNDTY